MMLGLFVGEDGISIIDGDEAMKVAPGRTLHPDKPCFAFHLVATDAVLVNNEALLVAFYEERPPSVWTRATRLEPKEFREQQQQNTD